MNQTQQILEFDKIKEQLAALASTENAKKRLKALSPFLSETELNAALRDTTEGKIMLEQCGTPPATSVNEVRQWMRLAKSGGCLLPEQLEEIAMTLSAVKRMKDYLNRGKGFEIGLPYYEESLNALKEVREEIEEKIRNGRVDDFASKTLRTLRNRRIELEEKMREKAEQSIRANKAFLSDSYATARNGRICIPVKKEHRGKVKGAILDKSSTGSTLFIEPAKVGEYYEKLQEVRLEEENEERRILYLLSDMLADKEEIMEENFSRLEQLDFIFAKAKLSVEMDAVCPSVNTERKISLSKARHPLMDAAVNVPLDFELGGETQGIIITGPNTGGKTVAMKTAALSCLMAQCGLHVPCKEAEICMNDEILADIGDGQNLSQNLSTFSAHITNVLQILKKAGRDSLVLLDELGSGTDPAEGMGIAIAVLEELRKSGALFLVTTHYPEVKEYGERTKGIRNARMAFDRESLKPLYRLILGESGESCAFYIAKKLGMPSSMLKRAERAAYQEGEERFREDGNRKPAFQQEQARFLLKKSRPAGTNKIREKFHRGDSVLILPERKKGIVCRPANEKGMLLIQTPVGKREVSHKRVQLLVRSEELYPEDYDLSIVFDTVENRKLRHQMERKYVEGKEITYENIENSDYN